MAFGTLIPWNGTRSPLVRAHAADRLFDEFWSGLDRFPSLLGEMAASFVPQIDVEETEEEYRVTAELPGLEEKDFELLIEDDVLTLKGEKCSQNQSESGGIRRSESASGKFLRRLRFDSPIEQERVKASYRNGVLTIVLPKPEEARPQVRTIPVETA